jgi:hypothetical protein
MKIFFMHIPKTAGTSFRRFLERSMRERGASVSLRERDGFWSDDSESYLDYGTIVSDAGRALRDFDLVCGHYPYHVSELMPPDTIVVTILRDPILRCLSHIKHQMAHEDQIAHPEACPDVNAFVAAPRNAMFLQTLSNLAVKYFSFRGHPEALARPADLSLERAVENCRACRFGFADEIAAFQRRLDRELFQREEPLPTRFENRSPDRFTTSDLTPENWERLRALNRLDLDLCAEARGLLERPPG